MRNRFFEKYIAGEHSLGTFTHLLSAPAIEALARAGLDYVIIDMEHSPIGAEHAAELVGVASGAGLAPFVRVDELSRSPILKMLDVGAAGLIVPQLETVEQARQLVGWAKFAPVGNRGYCPSRDGGWGLDENYAGGMSGYMDWANRNTMLIPQCETAGCLEHIEEIVAIEGVDGIFIGPFDLSIALGIPGRFDEPGTSPPWSACASPASGQTSPASCSAAAPRPPRAISPRASPASPSASTSAS